MVIDPTPGAKIQFSLGHKGERPDWYDARIVGPVRTEMINGRLSDVAPVIYERETLAGEKILADRLQNLAFAFDRQERNVALDGTREAPKTYQELIGDRVAQAKEYLNSLPESQAATDVAELAI